jgi:hypothetical protein
LNLMFQVHFRLMTWWRHNRLIHFNPNHRTRRLEPKCSLSARNSTDGS